MFVFHLSNWPLIEVYRFNDDEKISHIGKVIYDKLLKYDSDVHSRVNGMMLNWVLQDYIRALENEEWFDDKIKEAEDSYESTVIKTLTVAEMIDALSKLPPDAKLVMTESGFYSTSDFAEVMLPRPYKVENDRWDCDLPTGTQVYIIGHSHQRPTYTSLWSHATGNLTV